MFVIKFWVKKIEKNKKIFNIDIELCMKFVKNWEK